jgi:anti-anti-sigma factor
MNVEVQPGAEGVSVIRLDGRLDMLTAAQVKTHLAEEPAAGRSRLVVDMAGVEFIDSSGLGALISGLKAARLAGGDMRIANAREQARTVLELTRLDRVLRLYDSVDEALTDYAVG